MTGDYEQMCLLLTFEEPIEKEDESDLLDLLKDEWGPSGRYESHLLEETEIEEYDE